MASDRCLENAKLAWLLPSRASISLFQTLGVDASVAAVSKCYDGNSERSAKHPEGRNDLLVWRKVIGRWVADGRVQHEKRDSAVQDSSANGRLEPKGGHVETWDCVLS